GNQQSNDDDDDKVSTHSSPKAAGKCISSANRLGSVSTHSSPKAAGYGADSNQIQMKKFQHTAARRRLEKYLEVQQRHQIVSKHSSPKAAGSTFGAGRYQ
ncbi:hypothetical protein ACTHTU_11255, partial [Neisseria sp. P0020.S005]|uniref:hypothetical protein n=1 Tax=Neisseria sp. P0020.S005 TaxID=3436810 RepID=UPI003F803B9D